ncbi:MAG TPA: RIP metalloprotease RseP [Tissierellaceae bacterium]|nr:RIP metalloprotease RseP [Tissierellaceae bacterium]
MQTTAAAIFVFLLVILLHELGHFTVAKLVGIKVNEFSVGMGPKIIQKEKGETKYTLRILPIGGYVSMEGEDEESQDPRSFGEASPLSRMAVIAAGSFMNFILAIVVLSIVAFSIGEPTTIISETIVDSPAEMVGIMPGDKIVKIDDNKVDDWDDLSNSIKNANTDEDINVYLIRNGEEKLSVLRPIMKNGENMIGIVPKHQKSLIYGIKGGIQQTGMFVKLMFEFVAMTFKGQVSTNDLAGPVGVINEVGKAAKMGYTNLLLLLGFISVNLGFFNLLPIPALDGSRLVFIAIELIRGKPINADKENFIHMIGFMLLIILMLVVTYKDLFRLNIF